MVRSFAHKGLESFFRSGTCAGIQPAHSAQLREILTALNVARSPRDLGRPSWRLHPLAGSREGFWALTVRANWRLVFRFVDQDVDSLDHLDYH